MTEMTRSKIALEVREAADYIIDIILDGGPDVRTRIEQILEGLVTTKFEEGRRKARKNPHNQGIYP